MVERGVQGNENIFPMALASLDVSASSQEPGAASVQSDPGHASGSDSKFGQGGKGMPAPTEIEQSK